MRIDDDWFVDFPDEFFIHPFKLRLDLNAEQFEDWINWYFEELVKCDLWTCYRQDSAHGVEELCGCDSEYDTYRDVSDELLKELKKGKEIELYYPVFDPIYAHHLPDSGWIQNINGKEAPVEEDEIEDWKEWFPKRSCITCAGRSGDSSEKICNHEPGSEECGPDCYKEQFGSWCPLMNSFMEKKGWIVNRDLERFAKGGSKAFFIADIHQMTEEEIDENTPPPIRDFLKKIIKGENNDERRKQAGSN